MRRAGNAISIPLSWPMVQALKIARDAAEPDAEFIFPGTSQAAHRVEIGDGFLTQVEFSRPV
jgi:hypothetical protein